MALSFLSRQLNGVIMSQISRNVHGANLKRYELI